MLKGNVIEEDNTVDKIVIADNSFATNYCQFELGEAHNQGLHELWRVNKNESREPENK